MVFTKLLFNNIKEYTPKFMKTIPFNQTVRPQFYRGVNPSFRFNQTQSVICMYKMINKVFYKSLAGQVLIYFIVSYGITMLFWHPLLWVYQSTNKHRQLDYAIKLEKAYIQSKEDEEGDDDEDEDDEDEDEE